MKLAITRDKIVTSHDYPPIPIRTFDWSARWDSYDVCEDPECMCHQFSCNSVGHGATEKEAIADLLEQTEERRE